MSVELQPERSAPEADDEGVEELPPMDGAEDDAAQPPPEELDDVAEEQHDNPLDDTTGEDDPVEELEPVGTEAGWLDDAADAEELDVGPDELDDDERAGWLDDADEPGVGDEDFGLDAGPAITPHAGTPGEALVVDAGEEGPDADDEELREEDLPRLDADDDGQLDDEDFSEDWLEAGDDERPAWDDRAWERATELPRVGAARSVIPEQDGALVAGSTLLRVTTHGVIPVALSGIHGGAIVGVARVAANFAFATERGGVFFVEGDAAREVNGWRLLVSGGAAEIVSDGTMVWLRTRGGGLVSSRDRGMTWELIAAAGVSAITVAGAGELVALRDGVIVRGEERARWGVPLPAFPPGNTPIVRARGDVVVVAAFGAGAFRGVSGGAWERLEGTATVTALALVDDVGTTLVALHAAAEDRAWIARVGADKRARIVAEIGGESDEGEDPRVFDLAWNDAAGVAWAVGPFGLAALRPR